MSLHACKVQLHWLEKAYNCNAVILVLNMAPGCNDLMVVLKGLKEVSIRIHPLWIRNFKISFNRKLEDGHSASLAFFLYGSLFCAVVDWSTAPTTEAKHNSMDKTRPYMSMNTLIFAET